MVGYKQKNTPAISFYQREGFEIQYSGLDEVTGEKDYVMAWQQKQKFKFQCLENYDLVCKLGENMVTEKEKKACRFIAEWL